VIQISLCGILLLERKTRGSDEVRQLPKEQQAKAKARSEKADWREGVYQVTGVTNSEGEEKKVEKGFRNGKQSKVTGRNDGSIPRSGG